MTCGARKSVNLRNTAQVGTECYRNYNEWTNAMPMVKSLLDHEGSCWDAIVLTRSSSSSSTSEAKNEGKGREREAYLVLWWLDLHHWDTKYHNTWLWLLRIINPPNGHITHSMHDVCVWLTCCSHGVQVSWHLHDQWRWSILGLSLLI